MDQRKLQPKRGGERENAVQVLGALNRGSAKKARLEPNSSALPKGKGVRFQSVCVTPYDRTKILGTINAAQPALVVPFWRYQNGEGVICSTAVTPCGGL